MRFSYKIDKESGKLCKYDLDTDEIIYNNQNGSGIIDVIKTIGKKLSSKTAKEIAKKATTKAIEKGSEAVGAKMGEIVADKIDNVLSKKPVIENKKPIIENKNKGDQIIKLLKEHPLNKKYQQDVTKQVNINDDIMKLEIEKILQM